MIRTAGLSVFRETLCDFPLTGRLFYGVPRVYNSQAAVWLDARLAALFAWNVNYHPRSLLDRLRPRSTFFLAQKPERAPSR